MKKIVAQATGILIISSIFIGTLVMIAVIYGGSFFLLGIEYHQMTDLIIFLLAFLLIEEGLSIVIDKIPEVLYYAGKISHIRKMILVIILNYTIGFNILNWVDQWMERVNIPTVTLFLFPIIPTVLTLLFSEEKSEGVLLEQYEKNLIKEVNRLLLDHSVFEVVKITRENYPALSLVEIKKIVLIVKERNGDR